MKKTVEIVNLNHQGKGIGKIDGKVIFVSNAYLGEVVEVEVIKDNKKYMEGKVLKYIKTNDNRINYACPYYQKCGGCNIAHINYKEQLEFKKNMVKDIFKRFCNIEINPSICESENKINYRNKVTLHVEENNLGFYEDKTNKLIKIDSCLLINEILNKTIKSLKKQLDVKGLKEVILRTNGEETLAKFISNDPLFNMDIVLKENENDLQQEASDNLKENAIIFNLGKYKYAVTVDSFFQVNTEQAVNLYGKVREYIAMDKVDTALDLYCGTGTIAIYISDICNKVIGIEINKSAISCANYNKKLNNVDNVEFIEGDVSNIINNNMTPDLIVVDPPRNGLDNKTISTIKEIKPKRIIYVSCNPITLVRDINKLNEDYKLNDIELFDMFPNTYHVETILLLSRKEK